MAKTVGPFSPWRRIGQTIATSGQIGLGDDGKVVEGGFGPELEQDDCPDCPKKGDGKQLPPPDVPSAKDVGMR